MKQCPQQSCASTTYLATDECCSSADSPLPNSDEVFVPKPMAVEGPGSSVVAASFPAAEAGQSWASSQTSTPAEEDCTIVESVYTGQSVVPPPETMPAVVPPCSTWAGAAYAEAVAQEVAVPLTQEQIVYKPVKQIVNRPVEKTTYVPKVIKKEVVEFKQVVTDEVIEVPKPYPVETKVYVPSYVDHNKCCVVSQKYNPVYSESVHATAVECNLYEPEIHVVDVKVPKIVHDHLVVKARETKYVALQDISKAQWNSLVFKLNPELCLVGDLTHLPVHRGPDGTVIAFKKDVPVGAPLA